MSTVVLDAPGEVVDSILQQKHRNAKRKVNGIRDFKKKDLFSFDSEIEIIVHTRKNRGCEDITDAI